MKAGSSCIEDDPWLKGVALRVGDSRGVSGGVKVDWPSELSSGFESGYLCDTPERCARRAVCTDWASIAD